MYKKLYYMLGGRAESIVKKLEILYGLLSQVPYILNEYEYYFYVGSQVVWTPKIFAQNTTWKYFYTQNSKNPYPQKKIGFSWVQLSNLTSNFETHKNVGALISLVTS